MATINETKSMSKIFLGFLGIIFSTLLIIGGYDKELFLMYMTGVLLQIFSMVYIFFGGYGLGWEYKRISMQDDALVSGAEE